MLSALYGISRLGSEVTHPRLHGELVAEVRLSPGALLNLQLFLTCQAVWPQKQVCYNPNKHSKQMEMRPELGSRR